MTLPIIRNKHEQDALVGYLNATALNADRISMLWLSGQWTKFKRWIWIDGSIATVSVDCTLANSSYLNYCICMRYILNDMF